MSTGVISRRNFLFAEELVKLMLLVAGLSLMVYGLITLINKIVVKYKEKQSEESKPKFVLNKDILDAIKLLFGAQVVCLLFYITPAINENVKILLSLALTLGSFVGTFLIKEKKGYNNLCRGLIFVGQEFFGITMLLMMVNKGMGYSITVVLGLWTLFNFYIMKEFGKLENKMFFWVTLTGVVISLLNNYIDDISSIAIFIVVAVILLIIHIFIKKESIKLSFISNILFVALFIATMVAIHSTVETFNIIIVLTTIFELAVLIARVIDKRVNVKAFLLYIPYIVMLLLVDSIDVIIMTIPVFNIIVAALLASPNSICKKILSLGFLLVLVEEVGYGANVDEFIAQLIYICSIVFVYASLFTPAKKAEIKKGGDDNE